MGKCIIISLNFIDLILPLEKVFSDRAKLVQYNEPAL